MILLQQLLEVLAWLLLLAGCALLHVRVRSLSSLSFLLSISACAVWIFWAQSAFWLVLSIAPGTGTAHDLANLGHSQSIAGAIETALMLWVGGSFFLAVKALRPVVRHSA